MRIRHWVWAVVLVVIGWVAWLWPDRPAVGLRAKLVGTDLGVRGTVVRAVPPVVMAHRATGNPAAATNGATPPTQGTPLPVEPGAIPGEHVFRFFNAADRAEFVRLARSLGLDILGQMAFGNSVRVRVPDAETLRRLLAEGPRPIDHGSNYSIRPPDNRSLEHQAQTQPYTLVGDQLLRWLGMEDREESAGRGVTIAILDTAVGMHPVLNENQVLRMNPFDMEPDGPDQAHGTAVASLIIGNGEGVSGVAPGARIISIPVMNGEGVGDTFTLAQAIEVAIALNVDIINLSLGASGDSAVLQDAIAHATANDIAVVAASGNDAVNAVAYPARYDVTLAVGGVDANGTHLHFSNQGPELDLAAPAYGVEAAASGANTALFSGTSAGAPIVSGGIASLMSVDPTLTPIEAGAVLVATSDDAGAPGHDSEFGAGLIDIGRAQQHDQPGVFDMAAAAPYVQPANPEVRDLRVTLYAQNRGTEVVRDVKFTVVIDGLSQVSLHRNVQVGASVGGTYTLHPSAPAGLQSFNVAHRAEIVNGTDATPRDNGRQTIISVND